MRRPIALALAVLLSIGGWFPLAEAACTNTTNLALCKPALSDAGWGTDLNANFDTIDTKHGGHTANRLIYAGAANAFTSSANLTFNGTSFVIGAGGPHAIGGATDVNTQLYLRGTFSPTTYGFGLRMDTTINAVVGNDAYGTYLQANIVEAASGVHTLLANVILDNLNFTNGVATATDVANLWIGGGAAPAGTTNASSFKINAAPTVATNNYALWVAAGDVRLDGSNVALGGGAAPTLGTIGGSGPATAGQNQWLKIKIGTTSYFIPVWN